jgi:hypothetical protein
LDAPGNQATAKFLEVAHRAQSGVPDNPDLATQSAALASRCLDTAALHRPKIPEARHQAQSDVQDSRETAKSPAADLQGLSGAKAPHQFEPGQSTQALRSLKNSYSVVVGRPRRWRDRKNSTREL